MYTPSYLSLYQSGELEQRVLKLQNKLNSCTVCPHHCEVNRFHTKKGICLTGHLPVVSSICDHHGEEPCLSGTRGAGTVFLGSCNLRCVYCQNYQISQNSGIIEKEEMTYEKLAEKLIWLQNVKKCHNIEFVSPSHFVPHIVKAIYMAVKLGLRLPIVYNSNGYDDLDTLKLLDGIIDIYLPDIKYGDDETGIKYSKIKNYFTVAKTAVKEMSRQVGALVLDEDGIAQRGLIIRHLILPNDIAKTKTVLDFIADYLPQNVTISLMAQYYPTNRAKNFQMINRNITQAELDEAFEYMSRLGFSKGYVQTLEAQSYYRPDFEYDHPFEREKQSEHVIC